MSDKLQHDSSNSTKPDGFWVRDPVPRDGGKGVDVDDRTDDRGLLAIAPLSFAPALNLGLSLRIQTIQRLDIPIHLKQTNKHHAIRSGKILYEKFALTTISVGRRGKISATLSAVLPKTAILQHSKLLIAIVLAVQSTRHETQDRRHKARYATCGSDTPRLPSLLLPLSLARTLGQGSSADSLHSPLGTFFQ